MDLKDEDRKTMILLQFLANWKRRHRDESLVDVVSCPICETGQLTISMQAKNRHTHGRCTTINCVRWVE